MNTENTINEATNPACFLGAVTRRFPCKKIRALYNVDSQKYYYFHGKISECEFIVDKIRNILKLDKENP